MCRNFCCSARVRDYSNANISSAIRFTTAVRGRPTGQLLRVLTGCSVSAVLRSTRATSVRITCHPKFATASRQ